jgi:hypothetical protein
MLFGKRQRAICTDAVHFMQCVHIFCEDAAGYCRRSGALERIRHHCRGLVLPSKGSEHDGPRLL